MNRLLLFIVLCYSSLFGQQSKGKEIISFDSRHIDVIMHGDEVKGYYFFYTLGKPDAKNAAHWLQIYDKDMNPIHSGDLTRPGDFGIGDVQFNGDNFCLEVFKNNGTTEYRMFDQELNYTATYSLQPGDIVHRMSPTIFALPENGFAISVTDQNARPGIVAFSSGGYELWRFASGTSDKITREPVKPIGATAKYVALAETISKSRGSYGENKIRVLFLNTTTGEELFSVNPKAETVSFTLNAVYDIEDGYLISGEFFDLKNSAQGAILYNVKPNGDISEEKILDLERENSLFAIDAYTKKLVGGKSLLIYKAIPLKGKKTILVAELYDKVKVYDIVLFELNSELEVKDIKFIRKNPKPIVSSMFGSAWERGALLKMYNSGDYCFSASTDDKNNVSIIYRNTDKNDRSVTLIGEARFVGSKLNTGEIRLAKKPDVLKLLPASDGNVAIFEYFSKEKSVKLRVQKF